jgi:hypothetical protein
MTPYVSVINQFAKPRPVGLHGAIALTRSEGETYTLENGVVLPDQVKFKQLKTALASIPPAWPNSSYGGYDFITDGESSNASEIAVYGKKSGGSLAGYFVPPAGSVVEVLVKAIARIN